MNDDTINLDPNSVALTSGGGTSRVVRTGDVIGDSYRLKGLLGRGGMGYVFRAEHIMIGKDYALKMLDPEQINEVTWSRFQAEGKAIARLDHINIVKIYNMGADQGRYPYYVMDLLDGVPLSDCIAEKMPLSLDEVLDMFIQLASGFGYAHGRGIVHRDIKPSNVVLVDSGGKYPTAKIVDFGIAKLLGSGNDFKGQSQTATGDIFGSPYYMSPEQCLGTEIDHRSDIYSLGCTLFEVLCGRPPFVGQGPMQTVLMHQNQSSPSLESVSGKYFSEEMEALVAKMLMKKPLERYQSMEQVRHDLERIKEHKAVGKSVETGFVTSLDSQREELGAKYEQDQAGKSRRMKVVAAFACLALILAVVAGFNVYSVANRKVVPVAVTPDSAIPSYKDYEKRPLVESAAVVADEKILAQTKSIKSEVDAASNTKTFHCPPVALGNFIWERGFKSIAGIDVDPKDDGKIVARGDCQVPADQPLCLSIEVNQNRAVFHAPEILAKFGPDDISALIIAAPAPPEEMEEDTIRIPVRNRINTLVQQLVGWTNLRYFEFYNLVATRRALDLLDKHDTLRVFVGHVASVDAKYLAQKRFMRRLVSLELNSVNDLDSALIGLKGSQAIKNIFLANSELSIRGVEALASCPNLLVLSMDNMDMDNAAVGALGNIKSLKRLKLSRQNFTKEDIPVLLKLKDIECVDLDLSKWSKFDRDRLFAVMPCADPVVRRRLMRARSAALSP